MVCDLSGKVDDCSAHQKINLKVQYCVHRNLPLDHFVNQLKPFHAFTPTLYKIHSNITILSKGFLSCIFP